MSPVIAGIVAQTAFMAAGSMGFDIRKEPGWGYYLLCYIGILGLLFNREPDRAFWATVLVGALAYTVTITFLGLLAFLAERLLKKLRFK